MAEGGSITSESNKVSVSGANAATVLISIATSYRNWHDANGNALGLSKEYLTDAASKTYEQLLADHVADYQRLFHRVSLDLGRSKAMNRPTDERIKSFADGRDPQLAALMFQFGRYLLISSSRPADSPPTCKGCGTTKWNHRGEANTRSISTRR